MTESKILGVTIKAPESERYAGDNPWFVFEGDPQTIGQNVISTFGLTNVNPESTVAEIVLAAQTVLTATANAVRGGAQTAPPVAPFQQPAPQAPAQPQGWGQPAAPALAPAAEPTWAAQPTQPQQQAAPQQNTSKFAGPPHPEGKTCDICPKVLEAKKTSGGADTWRCPDWRWSNGNPNGHTSVFVK